MSTVIDGTTGLTSNTCIFGDSSGNVGIGTSSPNKKLEVVSAGEIIRATSTTASNDQIISIKNNSGTADTSTNIFFADRYAATSYASSYIRGTFSGTSALIFATGGTNFTNIYDAGTPTERMRIDSSGSVGIGVTANASAILDAQSTTKGVRMPNMTTTQKNAISTPAAGLMVFDTTLSKLCVYTGAAWQTITSA